MSPSALVPEPYEALEDVTDSLADLSDEEQVAMIEPTLGVLDERDASVPQPPQDGSYQPEDE